MAGIIEGPFRFIVFIPGSGGETYFFYRPYPLTFYPVNGSGFSSVAANRQVNTRQDQEVESADSAGENDYGTIYQYSLKNTWTSDGVSTDTGSPDYLIESSRSINPRYIADYLAPDVIGAQWRSLDGSATGKGRNRVKIYAGGFLYSRYRIDNVDYLRNVAAPGMVIDSKPLEEFNNAEVTQGISSSARVEDTIALAYRVGAKFSPVTVLEVTDGARLEPGPFTPSISLTSHSETSRDDNAALPAIQTLPVESLIPNDVIVLPYGETIGRSFSQPTLEVSNFRTDFETSAYSISVPEQPGSENYYVTTVNQPGPVIKQVDVGFTSETSYSGFGVPDTLSGLFLFGCRVATVPNSNFSYSASFGLGIYSAYLNHALYRTGPTLSSIGFYGTGPLGSPGPNYVVQFLGHVEMPTNPYYQMAISGQVANFTAKTEFVGRLTIFEVSFETFMSGAEEARRTTIRFQVSPAQAGQPVTEGSITFVHYLRSQVGQVNFQAHPTNPVQYPARQYRVGAGHSNEDLTVGCSPGDVVFSDDIFDGAIL